MLWLPSSWSSRSADINVGHLFHLVYRIQRPCSAVTQLPHLTNQRQQQHCTRKLSGEKQPRFIHAIADKFVFTQKTSCGARHNKHRPHAATYRKAKNSNFTTFSVARWQHGTARRPQSKQITNNLTFDPPTRLTELTQNLIRSSHGHSTPSLKISCKLVQPFSRNVADKETNKEINKQTNKQRNLANTIPRPRGIVFAKFLCLFVCLFIYFFVWVIIIFSVNCM